MLWLTSAQRTDLLPGRLISFHSALTTGHFELQLGSFHLSPTALYPADWSLNHAASQNGETNAKVMAASVPVRSRGRGKREVLEPRGRYQFRAPSAACIVGLRCMRRGVGKRCAARRSIAVFTVTASSSRPIIRTTAARWMRDLSSDLSHLRDAHGRETRHRRDCRSSKENTD